MIRPQLGFRDMEILMEYFHIKASIEQLYFLHYSIDAEIKKREKRTDEEYDLIRGGSSNSSQP